MTRGKWKAKCYKPKNSTSGTAIHKGRAKIKNAESRQNKYISEISGSH